MKPRVLIDLVSGGISDPVLATAPVTLIFNDTECPDDWEGGAVTEIEAKVVTDEEFDKLLAEIESDEDNKEE